MQSTWTYVNLLYVNLFLRNSCFTPLGTHTYISVVLNIFQPVVAIIFKQEWQLSLSGKWLQLVHTLKLSLPYIHTSFFWSCWDPVTLCLTCLLTLILSGLKSHQVGMSVGYLTSHLLWGLVPINWHDIIYPHSGGHCWASPMSFWNLETALELLLNIDWTMDRGKVDPRRVAGCRERQVRDRSKPHLSYCQGGFLSPALKDWLSKTQAAREMMVLMHSWLLLSSVERKPCSLLQFGWDWREGDK